MTRLIQLRSENARRVALVEEPYLRLLRDCSSVYSLAATAISTGLTLSETARQRATQELLPYDTVYDGNSEWGILPAIDQPDESSRCLISGTGLTHLGSARERQSMHARAEELTDSMKMFRWGIEGGRPEDGKIGTPPEWFYKGTGAMLRGHGEPLEVPPYGEDGGEEGEIAGVYIIDPEGTPWRVGMAIGNEFSDHRIEKKNYLYLASSKLRACSLGPELVVNAEFQSVPGEVAIERVGTRLWSKNIRSGEAEMCHSLRNIEHHHFKYETHRRPGDVHIHFMGADCLSFGENIQLADGDVMHVSFKGFGRALRNPMHVAQASQSLVSVISLG
jgi:hypothetical protein